VHTLALALFLRGGAVLIGKQLHEDGGGMAISIDSIKDIPF
jgi:hypothetical protein